MIDFPIPAHQRYDELCDAVLNDSLLSARDGAWEYVGKSLTYTLDGLRAVDVRENYDGWDGKLPETVSQGEFRDDLNIMKRHMMGAQIDNLQNKTYRKVKLTDLQRMRRWYAGLAGIVFSTGIAEAMNLFVQGSSYSTGMAAILGLGAACYVGMRVSDAAAYLSLKYRVNRGKCFAKELYQGVAELESKKSASKETVAAVKNAYDSLADSIERRISSEDKRMIKRLVKLIKK